jgi:hypothetical protein
VIQAPVAEHRALTEVRIPFHRDQTAGGDEVLARLEDVVGVDADREVATVGTVEVRVPPGRNRHRLVGRLDLGN